MECFDVVDENGAVRFEARAPGREFESHLLMSVEGIQEHEVELKRSPTTENRRFNFFNVGAVGVDKMPPGMSIEMLSAFGFSIHRPEKSAIGFDPQ